MSASNIKTFNNPDRFVEGWYWALPSHQLKVGQVKPVKLLGRDLALYRGWDGKAIALDAYCPHMGAHLAEGKVEADGLRCFFHNWKFDRQGTCIEMPCLDKLLPAKVQSWPTGEQYGMIWVWTGETPKQPLPYVPELEHEVCAIAFGSHFIKNCHPNVVMINAIDAHHFNTVHNLPLEIVFAKEALNENAIQFSNTTRGGNDSLLVRLIQPFYKDAGTYSMCYWYGSTGTVTLGPDFLHFYLMFALRLIEDGKTEGQTILITKQRPGLTGWWVNYHVLRLTQLVGNYFAKGDTRIFETINFDFQTPTKADQAIAQFIQHVENQNPLTWRTWTETKHLSTSPSSPSSPSSPPPIAGLDLPSTSKQNKLHRILSSALANHRISPTTLNPNPFYWDAAHFNLERVEIFQQSSEEEQTAILTIASNALLEEAYFVEKAGVGYMAKMGLLAETIEERMLYSLFAADETTHLAQIQAFLPGLPAPGSNPFLRFLADLAESQDKALLLFVIQVVLEGWGLTHYRSLAKDCCDVRLGNLFTNFLQAEARHHGAGLIAFNQMSVAGASRSAIGEALTLFLGMVQVGPQGVVGAIAQVKGHLSRRQKVQVLEELETELHSQQRLHLLRSLMRGEVATVIVQELEERGSFQPLPAERCI